MRDREELPEFADELREAPVDTEMLGRIDSARAG
jgi:hypothetical protein